MNIALTDEMVADMDETSDFMHQTPAPFPTIEHATGLPAPRAPRLYTVNGLVTPFSKGISIQSRAQGEADMHRRDSIRRGGL